MTQNYISITNAYNNTKHTITSATAYDTDVNTSSIATILIQHIGRFCEHYASDFLITWKSVENCISTLPSNNHTTTQDIFTFGIRENGVDGNDFLIERLKEWHNNMQPYRANEFYRKIFALEVKKEYSDSLNTYIITCTLKDISKNIKYEEPN